MSEPSPGVYADDVLQGVGDGCETRSRRSSSPLITLTLLGMSMFSWSTFVAETITSSSNDGWTVGPGVGLGVGTGVAVWARPGVHAAMRDTKQAPNRRRRTAPVHGDPPSRFSI